METHLKPTIYFDHAAATPIRAVVLAAMEPFLHTEFANPSSITAGGVRAHEAIESARRTIGAILGAHADEIIFTSGGTESTNLAIFGVADTLPNPAHFITSNIEHHAVLEPFVVLEKRGHAVTRVPASTQGLVAPEAILAAIKPETRLVSIMFANNEIGTLQPIAEIGRGLRRINKERVKQGLPAILFHTDACQALGYFSLSVERLGVDLLSSSAAKIGGPKGAGLLYVRRQIGLAPRIFGGGQEAGRRSGTENTAAIVGFAAAAEAVATDRDVEARRLEGLRDNLWRELVRLHPDLHLNGLDAPRLPNNLSITVPGVDAESLVLYLDKAGLTIGSGAACSNLTLEPSHVLRAIGLNDEEALSTIRITLGYTTTQADIEDAGKLISQVISQLREPISG